MAAQYHGNAQSPLPLTSVGHDKERPYQYEVVSVEDRTSKASAVDQRMKHKIRLLRVIQRLLALIISIVVFGIMVNTYVTFVNSRTIKSGGQTIPIYPVHPVTWPTFMMIATGAVSILFNSAIMIAYFWGVGAANLVNMWSGYWGYLMHVVNIGVWLSTSTTFQMSKGAPDAVPPPNDLYGWTCSDRVDQLTAQFKHLPVNFDLQCKTQQTSFAVAIINVALEIFAIGINLYAMRRMIHKKRMELMDQHVNNGVSTRY